MSYIKDKSLFFIHICDYISMLTIFIQLIYRSNIITATKRKRTRIQTKEALDKIKMCTVKFGTPRSN